MSETTEAPMTLSACYDLLHPTVLRRLERLADRAERHSLAGRSRKANEALIDAYTVLLEYAEQERGAIESELAERERKAPS